jgi:hypothetical protein
MAKRTGSRAGLIIAALVVAFITLVGVAVYQIRAAANSVTVPSGLTLNPNLFAGDTRQAYLVAQQHPELLAQLHCYCGCEQHEGHKSLLDCFRSNHGAGCDTCVGEAVAAGQMADSGLPADQIREALRQRFGHGS